MHVLRGIKPLAKEIHNNAAFVSEGTGNGSVLRVHTGKFRHLKNILPLSLANTIFTYNGCGASYHETLLSEVL